MDARHSCCEIRGLPSSIVIPNRSAHYGFGGSAGRGAGTGCGSGNTSGGAGCCGCPSGRAGRPKRSVSARRCCTTLRIVQPNLPAAAHGAVQEDQVESDIALCLGSTILLRDLEIDGGEELVDERAGSGAPAANSRFVAA